MEPQRNGLDLRGAIILLPLFAKENQPERRVVRGRRPATATLLLSVTLRCPPRFCPEGAEQRDSSSLEEAIDRLGQGIVIDVADTAHRWLDASFRRQIKVPMLRYPKSHCEYR